MTINPDTEPPPKHFNILKSKVLSSEPQQPQKPEKYFGQDKLWTKPKCLNQTTSVSIFWREWNTYPMKDPWDDNSWQVNSKEELIKKTQVNCFYSLVSWDIFFPAEIWQLDVEMRVLNALCVIVWRVALGMKNLVLFSQWVNLQLRCIKPPAKCAINPPSC